MPALTTNFNWFLPTVGSDTNVWGGYLDSNWTAIDSLFRKAINSFIANTAPTVAQAGTLWLDNSSNPYILKIYDGTNWVQIGTLDTGTHNFAASGVTPYIGDYKFSSQAANHGSWLLCNGQALSTTAYSGLFAVIGYTFGGSGSGFAVPDLRGQVAGAIGTGDYSGASTRTMGEFVGEETHTLTIPEMPSHNHSPNGDNFLITTAGSVNGPVPGSTISTSSTTANTGGSGAHNNMQPTLFVGNFFIYSGV